MLAAPLSTLAAATGTALAAGHNQTPTPEEQAQTMLNRLTPEERVGQLFLVTFQGTQAGEGTPIYNLIASHHIGGVVLLASNDNIPSGDDALNELLSLSRQLQLDRWSASRQEITSPWTGEVYSPHFIPLLIAINQEGDGSPNDQILSGLTPLPNYMAIGATWRPEHAQEVGTVLGTELAALGINLLLGPSMDVLEAPALENGSGLGTRSFGGDPFWVGKMGQAYIRGVHLGSNGKVLVAAKHFPGIGAADRVPEEEVATVLKLLEQLENFDLAPFYDVTGRAPDRETTADMLLTSHIRYQGFQGNIRATTRPISFDQQALTMLMGLSELAAWRENGGALLSDDLGSRAIRRFFELTNPNQPFDARRVALNAFLAGNDLLYLGNITDDEQTTDSYTTTKNIIEFFVQKYREDPAFFAQRVDQSVLRILTLKLRANPSFTLTSTQPAVGGLEGLGTSAQVTFNVARDAATLISPSLDELDTAIPDPPNLSDRLVFITDERVARQCAQCSNQKVLDELELSQAVIRLYGPQAGRQINPTNLLTYNFQDLKRMLDNDPELAQMENDLRRAHWIVFALQDVNRELPESMALNRFLSEQPELFQQKRVIAFAFNAPYFLDATNISKLTAYYGLYSKSPSFIDVAARLLFRELRPAGALPISVQGIGYDLFQATLPDPNQVIPLVLDLPSTATPGNSATPEPIPTPVYQAGNLISLRTGTILDHNGHPVPDGTPVQFIVSENGEINTLPIVQTTLGGVARATIQVAGSGLLEIRAESEPAKLSEVLRFDIPGQNGTADTVTPTPEPTNTPTPTETETPFVPVINTPEPEQTRRLDLTDWTFALLIAIGIGVLAYRLSALMGHVRWGVRSGFLAFIGGLLAYIYMAMDFPGSTALLETVGSWSIILITSLGAGLGAGLAWGWRKLRSGMAGHGHP